VFFEVVSRADIDTAMTHVREAWALVWSRGVIEWGTAFPDLDDARATTERRAES